MFTCISRATGRVIRTTCSIIKAATELLRRLWDVHLDLSDIDPRYVAGFGTIAAALIGGESPAEAAAAVASIILALVLAAARGPRRNIRTPLE